MRTETLTIVFTDIKGYTATTSKQSHMENAQMLKRIERLVMPVISAFSGQVIKSIGDAYMIVFRTPTEAVRCAMAIQDHLYRHNVHVSQEQGIHIRIALNTGEVRVHRGDVFGEPVNIAARIEAVTPADDIYFSESVYLTMNRSEIPTALVGDYELKGISEPVTVYQVKRFADAGEDSSEEDEKTQSSDSDALPFGGTELGRWRRARWVRRASTTMWAFAIIGLIGASYLRYKPRDDYTHVINAIKTAVEENRAVDVLALAGQIPDTALDEKALARRYRQRAVRMLVQQEKFDTAYAELQSILDEDPRDAQALMLQGLVQIRLHQDLPKAMQTLSRALDTDPSLTEDELFIGLLVQGYSDPSARSIVDPLIESKVQHRAIPLLRRAFADKIGDRHTQNAIARRLEKLGAGETIDWVDLAIKDLRSSNCKTRQAAIARLLREQDQRAVGPLIKLSESKGCASGSAKKALKAILNTK